MTPLFYTILFILWTFFWSFASVIIHRLKSGEWWILNGRSHCFKCKKTLKFFDLFPILSFLSTSWKCRYCKTKIPYIYPILELSTGILFALIWYFLVDVNLILIWNYYEILKLIYWLLVWFITILYIFYDILFLEIHEWIMLFWVWLAILGLISNTFFIQLLPTIPLLQNSLTISNWTSISIAHFSFNILSVWIWSTILWIVIIWLLYIIMLKELKSIYDIWLIILSIILIIWFRKYFLAPFSLVPMLNWIIWVLWIFIFFYLQILVSKWMWLWWGDLRIWIMIWLILWMGYSLAGMMIIYLTWSILSILLISIKKLKYKEKKVSTIIPFWPFMWIWFFITMFFLNDIGKIIEIYF
jgi:prepilin signal peptidase PulO-like enzyme (type II secretory pathway)